MDSLLDKYIIGDDTVVAEAMADELCRSLYDIGFIDPDESVIREHGKKTFNKNGDISFYWDDRLLFRAVRLVTGDGIRITHETT